MCFEHFFAKRTKTRDHPISRPLKMQHHRPWVLHFMQCFTGFRANFEVSESACGASFGAEIGLELQNVCARYAQVNHMSKSVARPS